MDFTRGTTIILVHGTFARNAAWTRPNSSLCRGLIENIAGKSLSLPLLGRAGTRPAPDFEPLSTCVLSFNAE